MIHVPGSDASRVLSGSEHTRMTWYWRHQAQMSAVQVASSGNREREARGKAVALLQLLVLGGEWQTCLKFRIPPIRVYKNVFI